MTLKIHTYTSREVAGKANSYLISGDKDAMLFDVVQTRIDALRLAKMVETSGKLLTTIFISHSHPDHFLGLDVLAARFPRARIIALPEVVADIKQSGPALVKLLGDRWGSDGPRRLVIPELLGSDTVVLEATRLRVFRFTGGESANTGALLLPETGALFCGDLVYNRFHLFLREKRIEGWLTELDRLEILIKRLGVTRLFPGHGKPVPPAIIESNRRYLRDFRDALAKGSRAAVQKTMLAKYPDYAMPVFLTGFTLDAYFPAKPKPKEQ